MPSESISRCISLFPRFVEALDGYKKSLKLHQIEILSMACEPLFLRSNQKFSLAHLVSLEKTLGSPLEFQVELCGFEQCLAPRDEIEMNDATAGKWGLRG